MPYTRLGIVNCNWLRGVPSIGQFKITQPPYTFQAELSNRLGGARTVISTQLIHNKEYRYARTSRMGASLR